MSNLLQTIKAFHEKGWAVTPLRDKVPYAKNWQSTTAQDTASNIEQGVFQNIKSAGFVIPKNVIVIDVDNHGDKRGSESLRQFSNHCGFNLLGNAGLIVNTASGGLHLYYYVSDKYQDRAIMNSVAKFPSLEFKHVGRQVVMPDSVLTDGRKYKTHVLSRGIDEIKVLPDFVLDEIVANANNVKLEKAGQGADNESDILLFKDFLNSQEMLVEGDRNNKFYLLACEGKDRGLSKKKVFELLFHFNLEKVHPRLEKNEMIHCVNSAFKYSKNKVPVKSVASDFLTKDVSQEKILTAEEAAKQQEELGVWQESLVRTDKGKVSRTQFATKNTELFLDNLPKFKSKLAVNLFSMDTIWRKPAPWHKPTILTGEVDKVLDDDDLIRLREALNQEGFDPAPSHILEAARAVSLRNEYHPVKEYFESLPAWDGVARLDKFFSKYCGAEDSKYVQQVGVKLFTAIVARIFTPGCKFDYLPILIGEQGIGKSTMLEAIAIKPQWYTDNLGSIDNKDVILRMRSKLIVENAELTMFDKNDPNTVKAFLSRRVDRDRLPYDRLPRDLPRQCIIIATTNKDRFLQDETGNRRMWPIEIFKIDLAAIKRDLQMFYAEAVHRFKAGEQLYLDNAEANQIAIKKQEERYNSDDWEPKIEDWIEQNNHDRLTIGMVWEGCFYGNITHCGFREQKRIGSVLRRLGWSRQTVKIDNKPVSGFKKMGVSL